tara:strand:- start:347 stop:568 length:222 start_codon:yes stop_codon:yes gene_type:complete
MDEYTIKMTHDETDLAEAALRHMLTADIEPEMFTATQDLIVKISDHNHSIRMVEDMDRPVIDMNTTRPVITMN